MNKLFLEVSHLKVFFGLWLTLGEHQYQTENIIHSMSYLTIILG